MRSPYLRRAVELGAEVERPAVVAETTRGRPTAAGVRRVLRMT